MEVDAMVEGLRGAMSRAMVDEVSILVVVSSSKVVGLTFGVVSNGGGLL